MEKTEVASGVAERTVNAFGIQILVRITCGPNGSADLSETMLARLTAAWRDSPKPLDPLAERPVVEFAEVTETNFEYIHSLMSTQVTLAALKAHAGKSLMLHAGGIARPDGSVAVIVGPSGRGKTTTMQHLGQYFGYVTDETIAITLTGEILPYRKPLSVVTKGHMHKLQIAPSDLGLLSLPNQRLFLGSLVLLERAENNESESRVSPIGFAHGVASVVEQSSYLIKLKEPLTVVCAAAAAVGGFKRLTVGHQSRIHEVAEQLFIHEPEPVWARVMPTIEHETSSSAAYLPGEIVDAVECEDGTVVFTRSSQVIVLDGIGPQLWRAACIAESWDQLLERIESHYGPAPGGNSESVIQRAAAHLIEVGVLRLPSTDIGINLHG